MNYCFHINEAVKALCTTCATYEGLECLWAEEKAEHYRGPYTFLKIQWKIHILERHFFYTKQSKKNLNSNYIAFYIKKKTDPRPWKEPKPYFSTLKTKTNKRRGFNFSGVLVYINGAI